MGIIMRKFHLDTSGDLVSGSFRSWQITLPVKTNWEKGGYGNVYRGILGDSTVVAVKSLKDENALGGEIHFQSEVEIDQFICSASHKLKSFWFILTCLMQASSLEW